MTGKIFLNIQESEAANKIQTSICGWGTPKPSQGDL